MKTLLTLVVGGALTLALLGTGYAAYHILFSGPSRSIAALRKVQAATRVGVDQRRFSELIADSRVAVDSDCPGVMQLDGTTCGNVVAAQKDYELAAELWRMDPGDEARVLPDAWAMANKEIAKLP